MPYFKWAGVDITGMIKKGKQVARSSQDLSVYLLQQGIALLRAQPLYTLSFLWPIDARLKGDLFKRKAKLLRSGVLLPKALEVVAQQSCNPILHEVLLAIEQDIQHGVSFSEALKKHDIMRDPIVIVMLTAGYESGNLLNAIEYVAFYFYKQHIFNKNIRAALAMPFLTLLFFIVVSLFIFIFIIPRFADMFSSLQQELPALTRYMIAVSGFVCSYSMIYVMIFCGITLFCMYYYFIKAQGRRKWNSLLVNVPFIGKLMWQHYMCQALQALALLIKSGVPLVDSLKIVSESIGNDTVKLQLRLLHDDIASGQLLSNAMVRTLIFSPEIVALIYVGEESGTLGHSLEDAALVYNDTLEESLRRFIFFLQPAVIILLGLLVTTLIFAVYSPIMQLSYAL